MEDQHSSNYLGNCDWHALQSFICMKYLKMAVDVHQQHAFKPFARPPLCKLPSYSHLDYIMLEFSQNNLTGHSVKHSFAIANLHRSFSTPCLSTSARVGEEIDLSPRIEIIGGQGAPQVSNLVVEVAIAMATGISPEPVSTGLGGAYFLHAQNGEPIAVAKPIDEEPLAFNNPKGFGGLMLGQPGMKRSIRVGETGIRELAAYLLDHDGFAAVPPTALVRFSHVTFHVKISESIPVPLYKVASLQRYVDHDSDAGDYGPSGFSLPSVHRIGILDMRLLNLDRHAGNILVKKGKEGYASGSAELVPIDHGLCLPETLDDPYFEWLHWPQASIPFSESEVEYISNLDPFKDADLLRAQLPSLRESSIRVLVLCTIFLKQATASGLCLADIGHLMTREFKGEEENFSILESLCISAMSSSCDCTFPDVNGKGYEDEEESKMFQFDNECEGASNQGLDVPEVLQSTQTDRPAKIQNFLSLRSMSRLNDDAMWSSIYEKDDDDDVVDPKTIMEDGEKDQNSSENKKLGGLMKSVSFGVPQYSHDSGGISFGKMSEEEWELFLENFTELLPEAFEARNNTGPSKHRLGSSCEF